PAMCGLAIDVPLYRSKLLPPLPGGATAASTSCPGATMSGLSRLPPAASVGPREEKVAISGAGTLATSVLCAMLAVGPPVAAADTASCSATSRCTVGTECTSALVELAAMFTSTMPTPPASPTARL